MTTDESKRMLIHRIAEINDKSFLEASNLILQTKSESTIYKTTAEQRKRIKEGRAQIENGEHFTNEQVEKEIDKWLNEK